MRKIAFILNFNTGIFVNFYHAVIHIDIRQRNEKTTIFQNKKK